MGQKQDHAALSEPLGFRAHQILIDHKLGRVVEVTELSLPEAQVLRVFQRVTILVCHGAQLIEVGVKHLEPSLGIISHELRVSERGCELATAERILILEDGMSMGEGSSFNILSDYPHVVSIYSKRATGHGFSSRPI